MTNQNNLCESPLYQLQDEVKNYVLKREKSGGLDTSRDTDSLDNTYNIRANTRSLSTSTTISSNDGTTTIACGTGSSNSTSCRRANHSRRLQDAEKKSVNVIHSK